MGFFGPDPEPEQPPGFYNQQGSGPNGEELCPKCQGEGCSECGGTGLMDDDQEGQTGASGLGNWAANQTLWGKVLKKFGG